MTAKKCDRCGEFYEPYARTGEYLDENSKPKYLIQFNGVSTFADNICAEDFDLCKDCATKFYDWINNKDYKGDK